MPTANTNYPRRVTTDTQPAAESSLLPSSTDTSITLSIATPEEYEQTCRLNAKEWKGFLTEEQYLDRERFLLSSPVTCDAGSTTWVLTSSNVPVHTDGSRSILAACETTRKTAYIARAGKLEQVVAHGIGSVFCRAEYRGRRYAELMMREVNKKLETYQQPKSGKGRFSVLYSDIGPKFYAKVGWKVFPSTHIHLKTICNKGEYHQRKAAITPLPQIDDLRSEDIRSLSTVDNVEARLKSLSIAEPNKQFVAFRPDQTQFEWHFMREEFLARVLEREQPTIKGAVDRKTGIALIWTRTYASDKTEWHLDVLHVHVPVSVDATSEGAQRALSALFLRAQHEAQVWDMAAGVEIWDPQPAMITAAQAISYGSDVEVVSRDHEHICSLQWLGDSDDEVIWVANERFAWC